MFIPIKNKNGVKLLARERVCAEDINVFPVLQNGEANANGTYQVQEGYAGFGTFTVDVPPEGEPFDKNDVSVDFGTIGVLIDGGNYSAYEGMTWAQWIASEYNTLGLVNYTYYIGNAEMKNLRAAGTGNIVLPTDTVVIGGAYYMAATAEPTTSFTIDGVRFSFDEGMTWEEWISSDYNTLGLVNYTYYIGGAEMTWLNTTEGGVVLPSDTIEVDGSYVLAAMAGTATISEEDTSPVSIVYDGGIVASLTGSQRATLHCKDKVMKSDVVVTVPLSMGGGGAEMNVAFGNAAPDDISKLWIKTAEPESLAVKLNLDFVGNEKMNAAVCRLPNNVFHSTAAAIGRRIYIFGGGGSSVFTDRVHVYDVDTNTARQLDCTMPYAANGAAAVTVGEKIYLFGGRGSSENADTWKSISIFDPATETFETLSVELPEKRYLLAAAAVGKRIYLFGGSFKSTSGNETIRRYIYMFNTESNAITQLSANLTETTYGAAAVAVGTKIYVFGGSRSSANYMKTICRFDTENYEIKTLAAELPNTVYELTAAAVGTNIYVFGGLQTSGGTNTICRFDTLTETLEVLDETSAKSIYATPCAAIGSKIYVFDGYNGSADHNVNAFTVNIDLPENHVLIEAGGSGNMMSLFPNLEIGVKNVYLGNADGKGEKIPAAVYKDGAWVDI